MATATHNKETMWWSDLLRLRLKPYRRCRYAPTIQMIMTVFHFQTAGHTSLLSDGGRISFALFKLRRWEMTAIVVVLGLLECPCFALCIRFRCVYLFVQPSLETGYARDILGYSRKNKNPAVQANRKWWFLIVLSTESGNRPILKNFCFDSDKQSPNFHKIIRKLQP